LSLKSVRRFSFSPSDIESSRGVASVGTSGGGVKFSGGSNMSAAADGGIGMSEPIGGGGVGIPPIAGGGGMGADAIVGGGGEGIGAGAIVGGGGEGMESGGLVTGGIGIA